jgi:hypothetical protein
MFNITQSGNIVNIDSPDVEFDITVSLISGTSFQVANIEAIGYSWEVTSSGTVANVKLIGGAFMRNGYLMDVEMNTPSRTLTPLAKTSDLIFEYDNSDGAYIYNVVAVSNYIYFYYYNTDGYMYLVEYDKNTDTTIELQIAQGLAYVYLNGSCGGGIAWITGRKILCVSDNDDDWTGLFVVDFSTSTVDRVVEMIAPMTVRSTIINNHILLVAFGYGTTGWEIYYLDYTAGGSWTQVLIPFTGNEALVGHYPFFVSNNYLVWFVSRINPSSPFYPQVQAWSYNLNNHAVQYSSWVSTTDWANKAITIRSASSSAYGKAYATASGWYQTSFPPYQYFDCWYEYVPFTNSLTLIYSLEMEATEFPWSVVFSTTTTTYIWNWYTEQFENVAAIGAGLGSLSRGVDYWYVYNQYSYLMDDNSNRALVCDGGYLKTVSAIGEGGQTMALSGIYHIHHIKYALVAHTISGDTERLYLIT